MDVGLKCKTCGLGISLCLGLLIGGEAEAANFTFTKIADLSGSFSQLGTPAINDSGTVAFFAGLDSSEIGIFTSSGNDTTTISSSSRPFTSFSTQPALNNSGTVTFSGSLDARNGGIFTGNGGSVTTIADSSGPFVITTGNIPALNDSGTVAFNAFLDAAGGGIFTSSGGTVTTIADTNDFRSFRQPFINNSGTVAFVAGLTTGTSAIVTSAGEATSIIADTSGPNNFISFGDLVTLNNSGTVAFRASSVTGVSGIFTGSGGPVTTIIDNSGAFNLSLSISPPIAINDSGTVAFLTDLDSREIGIFTGPDPVADKVIATGDPLFGSTVTSLGFSNKGLSNSGQLAFFARLADGSEAIVRTEPVPESTSGLALLVAVSAFGASSWHKHKQGKRSY